MRQKENIIIGHIALIQPEKRQDFVLKVVKALKQNGYNPIVLFAGECRNREYAESLSLLASHLALNDNVLFLGRRNDIPDLLHSLDLLIIPSSFEGFPLAGLEAASAKTPVVVCDKAGAFEFSEVSRSGLHYKYDDVSDAVSCIENVMTNWNTFSEHGEQFAEQMAYGNYKKQISELFAAV